MSTVLHYQLQHGVFVALTPPPSIKQQIIQSQAGNENENDTDCDFEFDRMMRQYASSEPEPDFSHLPGGEAEGLESRIGRQGGAAAVESASHFFVVEEDARGAANQMQESELDVWRRGVQGATRPGSENGTHAMDRGMCS